MFTFFIKGSEPNWNISIKDTVESSYKEYTDINIINLLYLFYII